MRRVFILMIVSLIAVVSVFNACTSSDRESTTLHSQVALTPPMGWNSFDAYDCRINEEEFRATVDFMAENLLEYGWEYAVIDYIWWHPEPGNWDTPRRFGHPNLQYNADGSELYPEYTTMDEYGRLLPAPERFPSAKDGQGFKPLADYVHSKGMKFGIHIMRGIHRAAWFNDTPVLGTDFSARHIAEPHDTCNWCNHMFGVDPTKPGAQEYYNSLFNLYASWGVDFIKADDMMIPPYHEGEIEMMRKAIDQCGRPMVLSLSCGDAPVSRANHLAENSNMWRISADFWDRWEDLRRNFDLLNCWSPFIGENHWPDADMLPIGRLSLNNRPHGPERQTRFTWNEQITLMTLWSIARSPLMIGADLLSIDDSTMLLLTNREVLAVNQASRNNRQVRGNDGSVVWMAEDSMSDDIYIAMFNLRDDQQRVCFDLEWEYARGTYKVKDLWAGEETGNVEGRICAEIGAHGAVLYRLTRAN